MNKERDKWNNEEVELKSENTKLEKRLAAQKKQINRWVSSKLRDNPQLAAALTPERRNAYMERVKTDWQDETKEIATYSGAS